MAKNRLPAICFVRECLDYNPGTGVFTWLTRPPRHFANPRGWWQWNGKLAGWPAGYWCRGYLTIRLRGRLYMAHRLAWLLSCGSDPGSVGIDHIDGNPSNNRISNLRLATQGQQRFNARPRTHSYTGVKGVQPNGRGYMARITIRGKVQYLGTFPTIGEAIKARQRAAVLHHGEFVRHG